MSETVTAKAKRLLRERHDRIRILEQNDTVITGHVQGDTGLYTITITDHAAQCDCPAHGTCSHLIAIEAYRIVRAGLATWEQIIT